MQSGTPVFGMPSASFSFDPDSHKYGAAHAHEHK
jgi:hypothetical protein